MKMTFTAEAARAATFAFEMQETLRVVAVAEATITTNIEPTIQEAAKAGKHQVNITFHEVNERIYKTIRSILEDNGYNASIPRDGNVLNIKW